MLCSEHPADYDVSAVGSISLQNLHRMEFRAGVALGPAPRIEIVVTPHGDAGAWVGEFYGHRDGSDFVSRTPDPESLLVVSGGVAYWVPALTPGAFKVLGFQPVRSVHCSAGSDDLILEGHSRLAAVDGVGNVVWESPPLVSDEFDEVRLAASVVVVRGYSAPDDGEVELTLDRATGSIKHRG